MMQSEFEGRTEQEAIDKAVAELGLDRGQFDVELLESSRKGFFRRGSVKIRVYYGEENLSNNDKEYYNDSEDVVVEKSERKKATAPVPQNEVESKVLEFLEALVSKMGYSCKAVITFRRESKIGVNLESKDSSILIGRKGKNLDAIQLVANVYAGNLDPDIKVVVDSENYRMRHEENIIRNAYKSAEIVRRTGRSKLLEPMNPFERRLVHTALNDFEGVETKSEGEGLYKQVRILPAKED